MKKTRKVSILSNTIIEYTRNHFKEYILVTLLFLIGLLISVMFINNSSVEKENNITAYISEFIQKFKTIEKIDNTSLIISSIKSNLILTVIVWLTGTTIIGMPVVLGIILFRGFCLGYTVSAITLTLGMGKGVLFCLVTLFLQNIFFIPALLTMGVSSIKLYKAIINDRRKENIKIEIIRHTIISLIMLGVLVVASLVENEISIRLLQIAMKYINF